MRIEGLKITNFRALQNVTFENVPALAVVVGANGVGKTTLFEVFGFLQDALIHNVRQAVAIRGGFKELATRGSEGPLKIELKFRESNGPLVTYQLQIGLADGLPVVEREVLKYRRGQHGQPWRFLDFRHGQGVAVTNEADYGKAGATDQREVQTLGAPDILAIKGLGQFQRFEVIAAFRRMIESWHISDFRIAEARPSHEGGQAEHLSSRGENLALVARFLREKHPALFSTVLRKLSERVPGISLVEAKETEDGRLVLRFQDGAFQDPFIARHVSDGTLKMFAYLLLLHDPLPHPLLCVEEPESHLYPKLLTELAEEFRTYADAGGQVFVSTHSPDFLNAVALEEVVVMDKRDGVTTISRASGDARLARLVEAGDLPGALWRQGLLAKASVP